MTQRIPPWGRGGGEWVRVEPEEVREVRTPPSPVVLAASWSEGSGNVILLKRLDLGRFLSKANLGLIVSVFYSLCFDCCLISHRKSSCGFHVHKRVIGP